MRMNKISLYVCQITVLFLVLFASFQSGWTTTTGRLFSPITNLKRLFQGCIDALPVAIERESATFESLTRPSTNELFIADNNFDEKKQYILSGYVPCQ